MNWAILSGLVGVVNTVAFAIVGAVGLRIRAELEKLRAEIADRRLEDREAADAKYVTQAEAHARTESMDQRLGRLERRAGG